jgi:hypothetical protein
MSKKERASDAANIPGPKQEKETIMNNHKFNSGDPACQSDSRVETPLFDAVSRHADAKGRWRYSVTYHGVLLEFSRSQVFDRKQWNQRILCGVFDGDLFPWMKADEWLAFLQREVFSRLAKEAEGD